MARIPPTIVKYVRSLCAAKFFISYLRVDARGILVDWGGYSEHYGLKNLVTGQPAVEQAHFLEGFLPATQTEVLEFLRLESGYCAHVHIVPFQGDTWVLLFDATAEHEQQQMARQRAHELHLLLNQQSRLIRQLESAHNALLEEKRRLEGVINLISNSVP